MGIYPKIWGSLQWSMLHLMAYVYPEKPCEDRKKSMLKYLEGMCSNLPCPGCAFHCGYYLNENPPKVNSRHEIMNYIVDFHNSVNIRTRKKTYTYDEARADLERKLRNAPNWMESHTIDQKLQVDDDNSGDNTENQNVEHFQYILCVLLSIIFIFQIIKLFL